MLHDHIREFGTGAGGRLFPGERADELPKLTYMRVWRAARLATFSKEVHESPLAQTPYDLRHACVSTWLNGGVPATQVAQWAGHSVEVLLKVYAKSGGRDHSILFRPASHPVLHLAGGWSGVGSRMRPDTCPPDLRG